jgi:Cyclin
MVYYSDRLSALHSPFRINSLTAHRFFITAATIASKGLTDHFLDNEQYACIGGIAATELRTLERELLHRMDWRIVPHHEDLVAYYYGLVERTPGYELAPERNELG